MSIEISALTPGILVESSAARVSVTPAPGRLSLRARKAGLPAIGAALGLVLPERIGQRAAAGGIEAICLGPDEWTILTAADGVAALLAFSRSVDQPHSLTDISGREVTLRIEGARAADLLTLGCPRDIATVPVGEGRRTVFDGATVVLWRDAEDSFRMDIWNSFAGHLGQLFVTGAKELAAEPA